MQRQFTIQFRVDYVDNDKNASMRAAVQRAMRHLLTEGSFLADNGVKPEIAAFSDDWFCGHEEIKLFDDVIAQGLAENEGSPEDDVIDPELIRAMTNINK